MVYQATPKDLPALAELAAMLWEQHTPQELQQELSDLMRQGEAAFFLVTQKGKPVGFAQCQLRHDYVEGAVSSPVGYLEGIFVQEEFRRQGNATMLLKECENWAREQGCTQFASDCVLENAQSISFHQKTGFCEMARLVCFLKSIPFEN